MSTAKDVVIKSRREILTMVTAHILHEDYKSHIVQQDLGIIWRINDNPQKKITNPFDETPDMSNNAPHLKKKRRKI